MLHFIEYLIGCVNQVWSLQHGASTIGFRERNFYNKRKRWGGSDTFAHIFSTRTYKGRTTAAQQRGAASQGPQWKKSVTSCCYEWLHSDDRTPTVGSFPFT